MIVYGASKKRVSSVLTHHHDRPHTCLRSWNLENQIRSRRLVTRGSSSRWRFGQLSPHSPTQPPLPHFSNNSFWRSDDEEFRNWKGQKLCLLCVLRPLFKYSTFNSQAAALLTPFYIGKIMANVESFSTIWQYSLDSPFLSMWFNNEDICMSIRMKVSASAISLILWLLSWTCWNAAALSLSVITSTHI